MEDYQTLLNDARRMNGDALTQIFDLYAPTLYSFSLRLCQDPLLADHIVGDVFAKFLDMLSIGKGPTKNLRAYLFQSAYHLFVDEVRYSKRRISLDMFDLLRSSEHTEFQETENRLLYETVTQAIRNSLTDYQRQVIVLRFLEGFNLHETAAILGKSVNVIKAAQHDAIVNLRKVVGYQNVEAAAFSTR